MSSIYKKRNLILGFLIVICAVILFVFLAYERNNTFAFSKGSGFYDSDFYLKIYQPAGSTVYYTLDGSVPTDKSAKYTEPILITDASVNPNRYSNIKDVSLFFCDTDDFKDCYAQWGKLPAVPDENVDKCTVVRAICVEEDGTVFDEIVSSYFVGYDFRKEYDGMKVISLISDPEGLFSYETGINVLGATFDENDFDSGIDWLQLAANYKNRGREWERETYFQLFDENKDFVFSQKCGMRVHGRASRNNNAKSYNLYARKEYDGNSNFKYDFWNTGYYPDAFVLYSCGQDTASMIRDRMVCELTEELSMARCHYTPCIIFLDGEYWGFRYICEKIDEDYFDHYYGIDQKDIVELKFRNDNPMELGTIENDSEKITNYAACMMGKHNPSASMEFFNENFDRDSILDYFALMIYIARGNDWPNTNFAYFSSVSNGSGYADGKWRAVLFDVYLDSLSSPGFDTIDWTVERSPLFEFLWDDESFRKDLYDRIQYIDSVCFEDGRVDEYLDNYIDEYSPIIEKHLDRFFGDNMTMDDFYMDVQKIRDFLHKRHEFFEENKNMFE